MGHRLEEPPWDPLHWTGQYYYESLTDIETREDFAGFSNPHIASIEAFQHADFAAGDLTYYFLVKLVFTFTEGQVYTFQAPEFDPLKVDTTAAFTWTYLATEQAIAPYAYYDSAADALAYLGFTSVDLSGVCDCSTSTLSGTATFSDLSIPNFKEVDIQIDASSIQNTVDISSGVSNFCGDFSFDISELNAAYWKELPTWVEPCESNCFDEEYVY